MWEIEQNSNFLNRYTYKKMKKSYEIIIYNIYVKKNYLILKLCTILFFLFAINPI